MIQTTVQKALDHEVEGYKVNGLLVGYTLYLVRDGETVFYIGKSMEPLHRLQYHLGRTWNEVYSALGECIVANAPASYEWTVELWKPEECVEFVRERYLFISSQMADMVTETFTRTLDRDIAEEALIYRFRPCLNKDGNLHPTPLPEQYKRRPL